MKDFLLLFRGGLDYTKATQEQIQQNMAKWGKWMTELSSAGKMSGGHRLNETGTVLKGRNKQITDGPFTEGKEIVGGYIAVKAKDLNEAVEIAKDCPIYDHDGSTEVREIVINEG